MRNMLNRFSRKTLLIIAVVAGVALLSGVGIAAASAFQARAATQSAADLANVLGDKPGNGVHQGVAQVTAINGKTLTLAPGDVVKKHKEVTITVSDQTKITRYGQPASLSDIQVGEFLSIRGKTREDISQIDILGFGAAGTIQALSDGGFTLETAKSETVSVSVSSDAQIVEEHGLKLAVSDLQPGEDVQVFGDKAGASGITAHLVHVRLFRGDVATINGDTITVTMGAKQKTGTVITNAGTKYYVADQQVAASALVVGDKIAVAGPLSADKSRVTAISIFISKNEVAGKVTAVKGNAITLQDKSGATWTITIDSSTRYFKQDHTPAALSDITVGSVIRAVGTLSGDHALAALVVGIATGKK